MKGISGTQGVLYCPQSLGLHHSTIPIEIVSLSGTTIRRLKLTTYGMSMSLGPKLTLTGGPKKLPEDFEIQPVFLDNEQVCNLTGFVVLGIRKLHHSWSFKLALGSIQAENSLQSQSFERPNIWDTKENMEIFDGIGTGTLCALSLDDFKKKKQHQALYSNFIRKDRTQKDFLLMTRKEGEGDLNLGMDPRRYDLRLSRPHNIALV